MQLSSQEKHKTWDSIHQGTLALVDLLLGAHLMVHAYLVYHLTQEVPKQDLRLSMSLIIREGHKNELLNLFFDSDVYVIGPAVRMDFHLCMH